MAEGATKSGLSKWVGDQLTGLGELSGPVIVLIVCFMTTFITEVASNTATSTVLLPVLANLVSLNIEMQSLIWISYCYRQQWSFKLVSFSILSI